MLLLTIAVLISAIAHTVTPALLPTSHTIAVPRSFDAASHQVFSNSEGYDYPTPRPQLNTHHTPGYEYPTPKPSFPIAVSTPKTIYLPPSIPEKTVPPQAPTPTTSFQTRPPQVPKVYIPPVVPHQPAPTKTPFIRFATTPAPQVPKVYIPPVVPHQPAPTKTPFIRFATTPAPQVPKVYIPPVVPHQPAPTKTPFILIATTPTPQVAKVYIPPVVPHQPAPTKPPFFLIATTPAPKTQNIHGGPYQYATPKTPFQAVTVPKVNVPFVTPKPPSQTPNAYLPPKGPFDHSTERTNIYTSPPLHPPFHPPQVPQPPHIGVPPPEGHHEHGTPYQFRYLVQDETEGVDFTEDATSDGDTVRGEYRVQLPDGRRQIVRYVADWINGYNAVVEYEGTAVYPDQIVRHGNSFSRQNR